MKFKVGDKVKFKSGQFRDYSDAIECQYIEHGSTDLTAAYNEKGCEIVAISLGLYVVKAPTNSDCGYTQLGFREELLVLFKSNNQMSNLINLKEKFVSLFTSEPEKSFRKAGITNGDGLITDEGQTVLLTWLLKENADKFKTDVVDPILADEKADK